MDKKKDARMKQQDNQERILSLKNKITHYETSGSSREVIEDWNTYKSMTNMEKLSLHNQWDKYFEEVKDTTAYKRWQAQKEAFSKGDLKTVKDLADHAKNSTILDLKKPPLQDPKYLNANQYVRLYESFKNELAELLDKVGSSGTERDVFENIV